MDMSTGTQLAPVERAALALGSSKHEQRLRLLAESASEIVVITNKAGYEQCHTQRVGLKFARVDIEKVGKAARDDANAFSKAVIGEERRLIGIIEPEETRLKGLQDEWEAARAAERAEAERIEQERKDGIKALLSQHFTGVPITLFAASSNAVLDAVIVMRERVVDEATYQDMTFEAENAKTMALAQLDAIHAGAVEREQAESERLAQAEADRVKAEAAATEARAEAERLKVLAKAERDQRAKADAERIAKEAADAKEARAAKAEADARIKQVQDEQAAERKRLEALAESLADEKAALERKLNPMPIPVLHAPVMTAPEQAAQIASVAPIPVMEEDEEAAFDALEVKQDFYIPTFKPSDEDIIAALVSAFDVDETTVMLWLRDMNLEKIMELS